MLLIAISLSMDAFSLALSIGTLGLKRKVQIGLSILVGIYHFCMPVLGQLLGEVFVSKVHIDTHFLAAIIFFYIATLMFKDFKNGVEEDIKLTPFGAIIFAIGVSLDSFGVGFASQLENVKILTAAFLFSIFSATFTFMGLKLGSLLNSIVGSYSTLFGAIIMCALGILNFCQFLF